jgi:hypothetical protein
MANDSRKGVSLLQLILIILNIVLLAIIMVSYAKRDKSAIAEPGTEPAVLNNDSALIYEMTPQLPDIDETLFAEEEFENEEYEDDRGFEEDEPTEDEMNVSSVDNGINEDNQTDESVDKNTNQQPSRSYDEVKKDPEGRRPDYYDFDWYISDVSVNGVPGNAVRITELGEILGDWKAYNHYDPDNTTGNTCEMLFNLELSVEEAGVKALFDWYYVKYAKNEEAEYETSSTTYIGNWNNGSLHAESKGSIEITEFYELDGKQYAVGTMLDRKGVPAVVALVREKE